MLTTVPASSKMTNVTAFVDVTNIAQYTQKQVSHHSTHLHSRMPLPCIHLSSDHQIVSAWVGLPVSLETGFPAR